MAKEVLCKLQLSGIPAIENLNFPVSTKLLFFQLNHKFFSWDFFNFSSLVKSTNLNKSKQVSRKSGIFNRFGFMELVNRN